MKKYVRISVDLTVDEYKSLHNRVIEIGCPKSEFVRRAIKKSLAVGSITLATRKVPLTLRTSSAE